MKVVLSMMVAFIMAISPAQNLLASGNHGLIQGKAVQQAASLYNPTDKVDVHCSEHSANQVECDSVQCAGTLPVIFPAAGKLVAYNTTSSFLLKYDLAFAKGNLSSLFRPPRA